MSKPNVTLPRHRGAATLLSALLLVLFWTVSQFLNVYAYKITGAIFELLWLPALLSLVVLPVLAFVFWRKDHYSLRSLNFYALILSLLCPLLAKLAYNAASQMGG